METRWIGIAGTFFLLSVALGAANASRLVPFSTEWGDVATWVQAATTAIALVFAALSVRHAAKQIQDANQREQARGREIRAVARQGVVLRCVWEDKPHMPERAGRLVLHYELINASGFPVSNAKLLVHMANDKNAHFYDLDRPGLGPDDYFQAVAVGVLAPREYVRGSLPVTNPAAANGMWGAGRAANCDLVFTDAWGATWLRPGTTGMRRGEPEVPEAEPHCMCCGVLPENRGFVGS